MNWMGTAKSLDSRHAGYIIVCHVKKNKIAWTIFAPPQLIHRTVLCEPVLLLTGRKHSQNLQLFYASALPSQALDLTQHL